jgi:hypothetical protein
VSVANTAAVDEALVAALAADATLQALLPDGVYLDVAPASKTRFVIVQAQTHEDEEGFNATMFETFRYRITARGLATTGVDANAAAYRIDQLLRLGSVSAAGYVHMASLRVERIKFTEVDAIDNDIRWQIAGGDYEIYVSPITTPLPPEFGATFAGNAFDIS